MGKQSIAIWDLCRGQLSRSLSCPFNPEFIAKLGDCLKELDESSYWFELLAEFGTSMSAHLEDLQKECNELLAIFTAISKKCKNAARP
jgi:four helix bundle protein